MVAALAVSFFFCILSLLIEFQTYAWSREGRRAQGAIGRKFKNITMNHKNIHPTLQPALAFGTMALCAASAQAGSSIVTTNVSLTLSSSGSSSINFTYDSGQILIETGVYGDLGNASLSLVPHSVQGKWDAFISYGGAGGVTPGLVAGDTENSSSSMQLYTFSTSDENLTDQYAGVAVFLGGTFPNFQYQYGYVEYSTSGAYEGEPSSITISQIAFNNAVGGPITIPTAAPEPSSLALLGLAGGVVALRRMRKSRTA
jgi:hypothetical protein